MAAPLDDMARLTSTVARRAQARTHPTVPDCSFHILVGNLGQLTLAVRGGHATVTRGAVGTPDCDIHLDSVDTADSLLLGTLSPTMAVLRGKARASGNTRLALNHLADLLRADPVG